MRVERWLPLGLGLSALLMSPLACGSDGGDASGAAPDDGGATPIEDGSPGADAGIDAASLPEAKGDPCRGQPLPTDQHHVAQGLCARLVAANLGTFRQITFAPNGDLFGVSTDGTIRRFRDADGDGYFQASEITKYASSGGNGNNCHIDVQGGFVYAGTPTGVKRFPYSPDAASGGAGEDVVTGQPSGGHPFHTVHVYDGYLYVHSGSTGNATDPKTPDYDDERSLIRRFSLASFKPGTPFDWMSGEVVTKGLRNANGFTRNASGRMYAVVNGLDGVHYEGKDVHEDNPGEQVVEIAMGRQYGYPFCYTAQRVVAAAGLVPPGTQLYNNDFGIHDDAWCAANSQKPATFIQAHSAPLDIAFFDAHPKGALPERWRGGAFVALHGSWDRTAATGYKVIWIPFDASGNAPMPTSTETTTTFPYEVVLGGGDASAAKDGPWSWQDKASGQGEGPRFAGVAISPIDGALYASSDSGGMLYRIGIAK